jgi:gliding motility-associated-like protein
MKKLYLLSFLLLLVSQASFAQLSNFTLTATGTDESCTGNGSLSFNVANTVPGSTIIYRIYRLPDLVNSIAVLSGNSFGGLTAGTYRIIATQTLGANSGTQQQDVIISDTRNLVTFEVSGTPINCDTGSINVNVLTGNPVTYEIISGPVLFPPQASNSFPNLHAGTYNIRVNDGCGEGVVQTFTLAFSNPPNLTITPQPNSCALTSCDSINISYLVSADNSAAIRYPLTVQVTIFPPSGPPIVQLQTLTSGAPDNLTLSNLIPFYYNQLYTYDIRVVDACGNVYISNGNPINIRMTAGSQDRYSHCLNGFSVSACGYVAPYTVSFLSAPPGFNPQNYNATHPGPFNSSAFYLSATTANEIPLGTYVIQLTDACNHTAITQLLLEEHEPNYVILIPPNVCDDRVLQIPANPAIGPLIVTAIFTASTGNLGSPIPYDVSGNIQGGVLIMSLPEGTHTIQGIDECGNPYNYTIIIPPKVLLVEVTATDARCIPGSTGSIRILALGGARLTSIVITQAPSTFTQPLPYIAHSSIAPAGVFLFSINNLPPGDYVLQLTDTCNNIIFRNITIGISTSTAPLNFFEKKGCGESYDSIALESPNGPLVTVIITAAPSSFPFPLPYNVSFNIAAANGIFYMNSFLEGTYTFYSKDICNVERTSTYTLSGYHHGGNIEVLDNCGSFAVDMHFSDTTIGQGVTFWLQEYNPLTNQWTHPMTGVTYPNNTIPTTANSYPLTNLAINNNIVAFGTFRIVTIFNYYLNGTTGLGVCLEIVKTFDFTGELKIISAYAIPCVNGGSQVFIITNGTPPLDYSITTKDGSPFSVENGSSNSFASLQPGVYNFRVEDGCGNIVNRLLDITTLQQPEIASSNLCNGLNGQLSVQPFSFLNYEWWKDGSPTTILSTTNTLSFTPYTNANAGVYHVRLYSTTTNSCVDRVLNFTISPTALPNAGLDGVANICNSTSNLNLFTLLNGNFDGGGTWEETTSSGTLIGNNWLTTGLPVGTYVFRYTVNGFCGSSDDSTVTVTLNAAVDVPIISANTSFCPGEDLVFSIQSIPNAIYEWSGPNNFSSLLQNPTIPGATAINAGVYTVSATIDQCDASAAVTIVSKPTPEYTYEAACASGIFKIEIIPTIQGSFDPNTASYAWTGPNGFISTSNPLILTNQPIGSYNVVVTNSEGCFSPQNINVANTFCDFPNVITPGGDGINDNFDLTGYDVSLFQVFSRWGRLVYEQNNYTNQWYGQNMHGGLLPDSTYYYFLQLRNGEEKHGWVFIGIKGER